MLLVFAWFLYCLHLGHGINAQGFIANGTLWFGQSAPLTGDKQDLGKQLRGGMLAAFKEANDAQRFPFDLNLITLDDVYDPLVSLNNTKSLIFNHRVFGILGNVGKVLLCTLLWPQGSRDCSLMCACSQLRMRCSVALCSFSISKPGAVHHSLYRLRCDSQAF
jgi:hypothetical protein